MSQGAHARSHRGRRWLPDIALLVAGGLLYCAAFPPHDYDVAAWITLVPLLVVAERRVPLQAFAAGFLYGGVFFAGTVAWVVGAVTAYFSTGILGALSFGTAICVLFVAVYVGVFAATAGALLRAGRWRSLVAIPALWVTYELVRGTVLTGLPWELLGHSQWRHPRMIQIADLGGVYAVSYLVAIVNVGVFLALRSASRKSLHTALAPLAAGLTLVAAAAGYGEWRIREVSAQGSGPQFVTAIVQGNETSRLRWSRSEAERQLVSYTRLSRALIDEVAPDLVMWPEYAVRLYPGTDPMVRGALAGLAARTRAGLVFGAPRLDDSAVPARYFNAAYHIGPGGTLAAYDKIRLVPFAEYWPLSLTEALAAGDDGTFSAGNQPVLFSTPIGRLGVLICYEAIFPEMARDLVRAGAEVLLNLSNDGWLDRTGLGAGAQHLSIAVFRTVETRRYLVRAATSGISGFVDPVGRPFALLGRDVRGHTAGAVVPRQDMTPYARYGDVFAGSCTVLGLVALVTCRRERTTT